MTSAVAEITQSIRAPAVRSVLLVGPASPRDLAGLFTGTDRRRAEELAGYRGIPVSELAKAHLAAGCDSVEVVTTATEIDSVTSFEGERLRLTVVPMRERARQRALDGFREERRRLAPVIHESGGEVVHAHWTYEFALAALGSGRPTVVTAHDAPLTVLRHMRDGYRAARTLMAYAVRARLGTLTAVSPYLAEQWRRQMGVRAQITIVPNSAPLLPVTRAPRDFERPPHLVDVADPGPCKNLRSLIRGFRIVRQRHAEAKLTLVGPGLGAGAPFALEAAREGPCEGVRFAGRVEREELAEILAEADIFVHPSLEECCSMAVLEAMRAGLPVIAGERSGGTPWMLGEGTAGVLTDVRNPSAIAESVERLIADPDQAARLREAAMEQVASRFSPEVVSAAYMDTYARARNGA